MTTLYHGSPSRFDAFDHQRIRSANGTSEGIGFYFTEDETVARGYASGGFLYEADFRGTKALDPNERHITVEETRLYLDALDRAGDYLSNWGDVQSEPREDVLRRAAKNEWAYAESDVDLVGGIANAYGNFETPLRVLYDVLGYDHIRIPDRYDGGALYVLTAPEAFAVTRITDLSDGAITRLDVPEPRSCEDCAYMKAFITTGRHNCDHSSVPVGNLANLNRANGCPFYDEDTWLK